MGWIVGKAEDVPNLHGMGATHHCVKVVGGVLVGAVVGGATAAGLCDDRTA